jgi:hypothetical protein
MRAYNVDIISASSHAFAVQLTEFAFISTFGISGDPQHTFSALAFPGELQHFPGGLQSFFSQHRNLAKSFFVVDDEALTLRVSRFAKAAHAADAASLAVLVRGGRGIKRVDRNCDAERRFVGEGAWRESCARRYNENPQRKFRDGSDHH